MSFSNHTLSNSSWRLLDVLGLRRCCHHVGSKPMQPEDLACQIEHLVELVQLACEHASSIGKKVLARKWSKMTAHHATMVCHGCGFSNRIRLEPTQNCWDACVHHNRYYSQLEATSHPASHHEVPRKCAYTSHKPQRPARRGCIKTVCLEVLSRRIMCWQ